MNAVAGCWWEDEFAACTFNDARLGQRLYRLVAQMDRSLGASLPFAYQDWTNTKAAYRFFANRRVSKAQILSGHFAAPRECVRASEGPVLVLQDTTEFIFQRESRGAVGITRRVNSGRDKAGHSQTPGRNGSSQCILVGRSARMRSGLPSARRGPSWQSAAVTSLQIPADFMGQHAPFNLRVPP
ncbi:hypothetical protein LPC10_18480 [Methylorubrum sp. B1-46]|uniref:IS4/Tn5 family transposase DNA-binding protein n=1 Tax=Methylorubrum sp. B1-46 TaxID=2897334 RepID=UPI001E57EDE0|nr:transposase DNA-binding-containing protein [Methylorubrum sp. B1-46]UGB24892.1 hypothetical protein LPC10_18480 [Methylorubrum sp. B1-46]